MSESKNPKFDRAFAAARKKFKKTGDANDYTFYFKGEGREGRFTVNLKGETKKDLMAKFAPGSKNTGANYKVKGKSKVRPKLRPKSTEPGELTPGQKDAQALVYKKYGGKPQDIKSDIKRKMAKFNTDGTVAGSAQKARPGAKPKPTLKEKPKPKVISSSNKKTITELKLKAADLKFYSNQLTKLLKDPIQRKKWAKLSGADKEKIKKSVIRSGRSIFKALDTVSPRAITTSEIKITKPKPDDKNPTALKSTNFIKLLQKSSSKAQSAYANLSAGEKRAVKSLVREEGLSLPQAIIRIKNG